MKYVLVLSLAFLALSSASSLRSKVNLAQKATLQAKTGSRAVDWASATPKKCQLMTYTQENFQGTPIVHGTDTEHTIQVQSNEAPIKSFRMSHGCTLITQDNNGEALTFEGDVTNLEDFGWYTRMSQYQLIDTGKKCTVRLFKEQDRKGLSIDIYTSNPDLEASAAFSNVAASYKLWDCNNFVVRAYPYKNYIGYLDLHAGNTHTTFSTGISSIKIYAHSMVQP